MPLSRDNRELAVARSTKTRKGMNVFGRGLVNKRGNVTRTKRAIKGYTDSGLTRVPPPMEGGK
jgi:hypothetical protein